MILGLPPDIFERLITIDGPVRSKWHAGRLRASADVRDSILTMAKHGSSPAQRDFLALAMSPTTTPTDGPITTATIAHVAKVIETDPTLASSPLVPLAERLARQLDEGGGSQTANLARELRRTLDELSPGGGAADDDDEFGADLSTAV